MGLNKEKSATTRPRQTDSTPPHRSIRDIKIVAPNAIAAIATNGALHLNHVGIDGPDLGLIVGKDAHVSSDSLRIRNTRIGVANQGRFEHSNTDID